MCVSVSRTSNRKFMIELLNEISTRVLIVSYHLFDKVLGDVWCTGNRLAHLRGTLTRHLIK